MDERDLEPSRPQRVGYVALGSNLGDRCGHLAMSVAALARRSGIRVAQSSRVFETDPVGPSGQAAYLNAAIRIETALSGASLLSELQAVERAAGRVRSQESVRWGPRRLDLDLLLLADGIIDEPGLRIPHPHMHQRGFVMEPLCDIAAAVRHPVLLRSMGELRAQLRRDVGTQGGLCTGVRLWGASELLLRTAVPSDPNSGS